MDGLARQQHLVLAQCQAVELGVSKRTWYRRIEHGIWTELYPGVVALPGAPNTPARRIIAAVLAVGHGAMASHASAAWAWVGEPEPRMIDVVVPTRERTPEFVDVRLHRPTDRTDLRPSRRHGFAVTNPLRTLVDLGGSAGEPAVADFLALSLVAGLFGMPAARAVLARHAGRGRPGVQALRNVLSEWKLGDRPPDSVLEVRMSQLFSRYGIEGAEFQREQLLAGQRFIPDFTFLRQRVIVEVLGWDKHGDRAAFERDPARNAILAAAGWVVLEFTWLQVMKRPAWVAARIVDVLRVRSAG